MTCLVLLVGLALGVASPVILYCVLWLVCLPSNVAFYRQQRRQNRIWCGCVGTGRVCVNCTKRGLFW